MTLQYVLYGAISYRYIWKTELFLFPTQNNKLIYTDKLRQNK